MSRPIAFLLLAYYTLGAFLLGGNFSVLADLPAMYAHCQANEDKDLTPMDFVTDHLVNIDALFDSHPPGDEQRPHSGKDQEHISTPPYTPLNRPAVRALVSPTAPALVSCGEVPDFYHFDFSGMVFRPPCA